MSAILNVPSKLGMVNVELSAPGLVALVAAGIVWPVLLVDGKNCGPVIEPVGPMIWSTWLGVKVLTCMGRSNVTLSVLVVPSVIRLSLPRAARHRGAHDLRAGHDQRQRVLIERRAEDARGALT